MISKIQRVWITIGTSHWAVRLALACGIICLESIAGAQDTPIRTASQQAAPPGVLGTWQAFDEKTHRATSWVELYLQPGSAQGTVAGRVIKVIDAPGHAANPTCERCDGPNRGKPIQGLTILWGLTPKDSDFSQCEGGTVLDPGNGKTYRCSVRLREDGQLEVRGYLGLPMFGRTQLWRRVPEAKGPQSPPPR